MLSLIFLFGLFVTATANNFTNLKNVNTNSIIFESSEFASMLKYIIQSYISRSTVILLEAEIQKVAWINAFLKTVEYPRIVIAEGENSYNLFGFYILFPEYGKSYGGLFREKNHVLSKFLLVWSGSTTERVITSLFEEFWRDRRTNIISMARMNDEQSFKLYTFFPYTENKCGSVGQPVVLDVWNQSLARLQRNIDFFERDSVNFKGCTLKVIGNHKPPDNVMQFDAETNRWTASGASMNILHVAEQYFNFTSHIVTTNLSIDQNHSWYYSSEELDYICDAVDKEMVDLAFGWYSYSSIEMDNLDARVELGSVSSIDCFGWVVPYRAGAKPPNSVYFTKEFKMYTWILIVFTFLLTCAVTCCVLRKNDLSIFLILQTFFEQPVNLPQQRGASFKIIFCNFCFYSLIVSAAYKTSLSSFITVSFHGRDFFSDVDILKSSLQISGSPEMLKVLTATATVESNFTAKILKRFNILPICNFEDVVKRVIHKRDVAVLGVKRNLYYYSKNEAKRLKVKIPFRFIPGCLIRPHTTHFLYKRGSYLIRPFNFLLNRLFESGIISYWILHLGSNKILPIERFKGRVLKLSFFKDIFYLLFMGYLASSLILLLELYIFKCNNKRQHIFPKLAAPKTLKK